MICESCQSPQKSVWPPSDHQPRLHKIVQSGWFGLNGCADCEALWVKSPYEPHASYVYLVSWPLSNADFVKIAGLQNGLIIAHWCSAKIMQAWEHMGAEDKADVEFHRRRSYGRNPIDEPATEPDLSLFLS